MEKTNKELVAAGHELAKTLSADTPLIEIAKFVSELATRLDVQVVLAQQLAAQNVAAMDVVVRLIGQYSFAGYHAVQNSNNPPQSLLYDAVQVEKITATYAWLNDLRANGADAFSADCLRKSKDCIDPETAESWRLAGLHAADFATKLRTGEVSNG